MEKQLIPFELDVPPIKNPPLTMGGDDAAALEEEKE